MNIRNDQPLQRHFNPGRIGLFGSGETTPSGRKIFAELLRGLPEQPRIAILETPAGFELNSSQVARRVATFLRQHLQNFHPQIEQVAARKRGTAFSPDDPQIVAPILGSNMIFMGPGSPTYAVRQLQRSLAWDYLIASHRLGASLALASAATIAISAFALPVYEIFKVGEDIHWKEGLDLLGAYGLSLVFVPHWDNNEGGAELDTRRCFMGRERFDPLLEMLPQSVSVVGIDENTGLIIELSEERCRVIGKGEITVLREGNETIFRREVSFPIGELGEFELPEPETDVPEEIWEKALSAMHKNPPDPMPPEEVVELVEFRESARQNKDWSEADILRAQIEELGWQVLDTPEGPELEKVDSG